MKVIYIYRNPIDVAWSSYIFLNETGHKSYSNLNQFVDEFLNGDVFFGKWDKHALQYKTQTNDIILVSYEDLISDTFGQVKAIVNFISDDKPDSPGTCNFLFQA